MPSGAPAGNARPLTRARTTLDLSGILSKTPEPLKAVPGNAAVPIEIKPVTQELIQSAWDAFRESRKDQVALYLLLQRALQIEDTTIRILLSNLVEEQLLDEIRTDLLTHLRETLSNSGVTLISSVTVAEATKTAYTGREKLDKLAEQYPLINALAERLGLDPEF